MLSTHVRRHRKRSTLIIVTGLSLSLLVLTTLYILSPSTSPVSPSRPDPVSQTLLSDPTDPSDLSLSSLPDLIDEFDSLPDPSDQHNNNNDDDEDDDMDDAMKLGRETVYTFDHVSGGIRRPFDKRSIDQWDDYVSFGKLNTRQGIVSSRKTVYKFDHVSEWIRRPIDKRSIDQWANNVNALALALQQLIMSMTRTKGTLVFGSDDVAVDEHMVRKAVSVRGVEDALLLKGSALREGWGPWFDAKSDFLKRDRMFRSNLEGLNPLNNPMLQDPDGVGVTGLTKGDRAVMKGIIRDFKKVPFLVKKPLGVDEGVSSSMEKPLIVKNSGDSVDETGSVKKPQVVTGLENSVEDMDIAGMKDVLVVKSLENGVKDLTKKGMKKLLVVGDSNHELELRSEGVVRAESISNRVSAKTEEMSSMKKPQVIKDSTHELRSKSEGKSEVMVDGETKLINAHNGDVNVETKPLTRRALRGIVTNLSAGRRTEKTGASSNHKTTNLSRGYKAQLGGLENVKADSKTKKRSSAEVYANGRRWGYFPGLHPRLSFSNFMDAFFRKEKCSMRVFMVWNSPPWAFTVRHQRGIESLLSHHRDACLVVFSETIELNFFEGFVKDGFKVAVAMPNLDELLKDTPTHDFASVWYEWRQTPFYSTHYSELIRLAALYKYGGIYLDSDVIVLKPLSSSTNTVGLVDSQTGSSLSGAVMSFRKHSPFIMECLTEFYSTYEDTKLRWNGAGLLTRVASHFSRNRDVNDAKMELKLQHSSIFFPISADNIIRYFSAPETETERAKQNRLVEKILKGSFTFHFWNSLTSALVPEPESVVARIINQHCIRCSDVL